MIGTNYIFGIGGFVLGVAVGAVATAIVSKKAMDKRIAAIEDTNKELVAKRKKPSGDATDALPENAKEIPVHVRNDISDTGTGSSEFEGERQTDEREYDDLTRAYRSEGDGTFKPALSFPHIITAEEYDEPNGYDKRHVLYYEADDVAIDTIRGIELDPVADLGQDFGILTEDAAIDSEDGVIYIRNPKISTDFAVDWTCGASVVE